MNQDNVPSFLSTSKNIRWVPHFTTKPQNENTFRHPLLYTRLRFGGRQPLCGSGVTSSIEAMRNPACWRAEMADSRPEPGPLTLISISRTPLRIAILAQRCAACCAAKGVLLREPLKPTQPAEPEQIVSPSGSVIVINVLLNVAFMYTIALAIFFLTFRFAVVGIIRKILK
jgi:hypothetical protein